jgi:hypothetical protein
MTSVLSQRPPAGHKIRVLTAEGLEEFPAAAPSTALCALDQPLFISVAVMWIYSWRRT